MNKFDTGKGPGAEKVLAEPPNYVPKPNWQPFPGFSFIFDNPTLPQSGAGQLQRISMQRLDHPSLVLYKALAAAVDTMDCDSLAQKFSFFALPPSTYHVTVWDGVSRGNVASLAPDLSEKFGRYFEDAEKSSQAIWPPLSDVISYADHFRDVGEVSLRFRSLLSRGRTVLVADLEPSDEESRERLAEIEAQRRELDSLFSVFGKLENHVLRPHVAIGYFADEEEAYRAIRQHMDEWRKLFRDRASETVVKFSSVTLYAFTDMVTYFKRS